MAVPVTLDQILARINVEAAFRKAGVTGGRRRGDEWAECTCPFCGDPEHLNFNVKTSQWRCMKCNETGNIVTLRAKLQGSPTGPVYRDLVAEAGLAEERPDRRLGRQGPGRPPGSGRQQQERVHSEGLPAADVALAAVYERFVALSYLTDVHRHQLKSKRGFTQTTIENAKLRSGGPQVAGLLSTLAAEFSEQDLVKAGLLVDVNGRSTPNDQLLEDRVLIPYLDENGATYHLRPHKLGFAGIPLQPYARYLLKERPEHVVLTEGEFKALALHQLRIPALAVPGVSSFGARNFDRLVDLLREFSVRQVTVVFDNEVKDDPNLPGFKPRADERYDTQVWSYLMAYKLGRQGFVTRVGWLPDEWRKHGKADWDGALAQGRTRDQFLAVIGRAVAPKDYLEQLSDEARRVVQRKVTRYFTHLNIRREFNRYVVTRHRNGEAYDETISNFVINIRSSFFTPEGVVRSVQLVNEYGEHSAVFALNPGDMAGLNEFKKFCFGKGNYVFEGRTADLVDVWKYEFLRDSGELIYMPDRIGRIEPGLWLFGNLAVHKGKVYRPGNDGIVWIEGRGYKPQSLQLGPRGEAVEDAIPALAERKLDIVDVAQKLRAAVGGYEAYIGIGWVIATLFGEDIFQRYKCLPILFPHGKRESGKSTYMRWLMSFFGVETEGYGIAETTQNFIARALSYYSGLGCWFDEYRNEPRVVQKDGFFRSAYNRQLSGKGTATAFQAKGFAVHAGLAVSGEELPRDNGLYTRLVPVQISAHKRDRTWFEWLNRHCTGFSAFTLHLLQDYDRYRDRILQNIAELKAALVARDVSDRTAENWAICAGAFDAVVLQDDEFIRWVERTCQEIRRTGEAEHLLNVFWDDVNTLTAMGEIGKRHLKVDGEQLYVWFVGVHDIWAAHYRRKTGREPFERSTLMKYFQDEPYYGGIKPVRMDRVVRKVHVVDLSPATDTIREIADTCLAQWGQEAEEPGGVT